MNILKRFYDIHRNLFSKSSFIHFMFNYFIHTIFFNIHDSFFENSTLKKNYIKK